MRRYIANKAMLYIEEGPIIRQLEKNQRQFHIPMQAYYGGTFVGNHVHRSLKVIQGIPTYSIVLLTTQSQ